MVYVYLVCEYDYSEADSVCTDTEGGDGVEGTCDGAGTCLISHTPSTSSSTSSYILVISLSFSDYSLETWTDDLADLVISDLTLALGDDLVELVVVSTSELTAAKRRTTSEGSESSGSEGGEEAGVSGVVLEVDAEFESSDARDVIYIYIIIYIC